MKIGKLELKPEINELVYYLHIVIIAVIVLAILKYVFTIDMFSFDMVWKVSIAIVIADIIAHSILKLD